MKKNFDVNRIRKDFPCLNQKSKNKLPLYFDNACMTLKPVQVIDAISEYYINHPSCHSRSVHKFGLMTNKNYEQARLKIKDFINARFSDEIIFTKNTSEAINIIASSLDFKKNDVVITSDFEHNSNLLPWKLLAEKGMIKHKELSLSSDFNFNLDDLEEVLKNNRVKLVSIIHTSHVTGQTLDAKNIIDLAHKYGALVFLDCAQSISHENIDVQKLNPDFIAFSFHKILGPCAMGMLYGRKELLEKMVPSFLGGNTASDVTETGFTLAPVPHRFEYGLQNYSGVQGAAAAVQYFSDFNLKDIKNHILKLNAMITHAILDNKNITIIGPPEPEKRGNIINFHVKNIDSGELSLLLDQNANIMVRSGVLCCHSWYHKKNYKASLRASLYLYNTEEEINKFIKTLLDFIRYF
jgi:cysteine desulfurase/selenocysteine lyase